MNAAEKENYKRHIKKCEGLAELHFQLIDIARALEGTESRLEDVVDLTSLPTYGGEAPANTEGVWSWNDRSILTGEGNVEDWVIIARESTTTIEAGYRADNGDSEEYFPDAESGLEAAREYVSGGEWGECEKTFWVTVRTWRVEGDERIEEESHKIEIEPEEPECTELENHAWDSSGVYGHGGGVCEKEICRHCGTYRVSDSWAQDPFDGTQGLRSIEYREADEESREYVANEAGE